MKLDDAINRDIPLVWELASVHHGHDQNGFVVNAKSEDNSC